MNDERIRCAEAALHTVPDDYLKVDAAEVAGQDSGQSFHHGMHIGWAWGEDERSGAYLDFLSEHRHPGMAADRYFLNGRTEPIATPASMRAVSPDPAEDAELERQFFENNRAAYADLRNRGLLPPVGHNVGSQDINEYLLKGGSSTEGTEPGESELASFDRGDALLGGGWDERLRDELEKPYWRKLLEFVADERGMHTVSPPPSQTFRAFAVTRYDDVRVVILGQDPYPNPGEAHGLAFSVPADVPKPGSLKNIHKILESDLSETLRRPVTAPDHGNLEAWAEQGVLLLNTALTVRAGTTEDRDAHRRWRWEKQGWTTFTDAVIRAISDKNDRVVFILWGNDAKQKEKLIDTNLHAVISSSHPSPNFGAAGLGFLASRPFSEANEQLAAARRGEIDWLRIGDGA
jgi:uracil-DNA glycosylase